MSHLYFRFLNLSRYATFHGLVLAGGPVKDHWWPTSLDRQPTTDHWLRQWPHIIFESKNLPPTNKNEKHWPPPVLTTDQSADHWPSKRLTTAQVINHWPLSKQKTNHRPFKILEMWQKSRDRQVTYLNSLFFNRFYLLVDFLISFVLKQLKYTGGTVSVL